MTIINKKNAEGFTLIELLVAFGLFAIILMLLYNSLTYAGRVTAQGVNILQKVETMDQLDRFLRQLVSQSYPENNRFKGSSQTVEFVAPLSQAGIDSNLYHIIIELTGPHNARQLMLRWSSMESPLNQNTGAVTQNQRDTGKIQLLDGITSVQFSYQGKGERSNIWLSQWNQAHQPALIRIDIKQINAKNWPPLVISLPRTHTADCQFDPVSRQCRKG
ncbi:prepilin-type N-terminal cleavage/methylation domain-containing protein [Porticoccaceae bacterium]|nr:prepilin-type N-terminal cleavage/methylation domain-containing protein [Porticoccaceae bacterium]